MQEIIDEVKKALEEKGYELPKFKNPDQRAKFIGEKGYDPDTLIIATRRLKDACPGDWQERISEPPKMKAKPKPKAKKAKKKE